MAQKQFEQKKKIQRKGVPASRSREQSPKSRRMSERTDFRPIVPTTPARVARLHVLRTVFKHNAREDPMKLEIKVEMVFNQAEAEKVKKRKSHDFKLHRFGDDLRIDEV